MPEMETEVRLVDESSDDSRNAVQNGCSQKFNGGTGRQRMSYDIKEKGGVNESKQYPDRPGQQDCIYFLRTGSCGYGMNCRYNHPNYVAQEAVYGIGSELPERDGEPDFFLEDGGTCKYGSSCKYNHPRDKNGAGPVSFNILGLPVRPEEVPCKYYLRTGQCKFGPACKFHHPQPTVPAPVFPVKGNMPFGSAESSNLPTRAFPASPMPMTAPNYIYDSPMHTPQAFMHMALSPPHAYFTQQAWNALSGNISHFSSTSPYGSSHSYSSNSKSLGESYSNGQVHHLPILTHYPERPDQPECRYFANYGRCKYGPDCKFNHPTSRMLQLLPQPLIPIAYPGQPLCSSYITYGVCKNGSISICKFPHQGMGYPMNYGLIQFPPTSIPVFGEPVSGGKSSSAVISSETSSPSKSTEDLSGVNNLDSISERTQDSDTNGQLESTTMNTNPENNGQKKQDNEEEVADTPGNSSPLS